MCELALRIAYPTSCTRQPPTWNVLSLPGYGLLTLICKRLCHGEINACQSRLRGCVMCTMGTQVPWVNGSRNYVFGVRMFITLFLWNSFVCVCVCVCVILSIANGWCEWRLGICLKLGVYWRRWSCWRKACLCICFTVASHPPSVMVSPLEFGHGYVRTYSASLGNLFSRTDENS